MSRPVTVLVTSLSLTLATVSQAAPEWSRHHGFDFWNMQSELLQRERQTGMELDEQQLWLHHHVEATSRIVEQLFMREITLKTATQEVLQIQEDRSEWLAQCRIIDPTAIDDQEVAARALIRKVESLLARARFLNQAEEEHLIMLRLNELSLELQAMICQSHAAFASTRR